MCYRHVFSLCVIAECCRCVLLLFKLVVCPIDPIPKAQTLSCCAVLIFIVLLIFMFVTYTTSSKIGNIGVMYDNLVEVARVNPVSGNRGGSYLTFWSIDGLKFGVLQTVSCWGKLQNISQVSVKAQMHYARPQVWCSINSLMLG